MKQTSPALQPFDVSRVLTDAFAVFREGWRPMLPVFFIAGMVDAVVMRMQPGWSFYSAVEFLAFIVTWTASAAIATRLLYETAYGRPPRLPDAIAETASRFWPLLLTGALSTITLAVGAILLVVPGVWVLGATSVIIPLIIIERAGTDALKRSFDMTEGYRWQSAGALGVIFIGTATFNYVATTAVSNITEPSSFLFLPFDAILNLIEGGLLAAVSLSIHKRLNELKSSGPDEELSEIFR